VSRVSYLIKAPGERTFAHTTPRLRNVRFGRIAFPGFRPETVIEESPLGRRLVVSGQWSRGAERLVAKGAVDDLVLNYARGFQGADLEFLRPWPLRHLLILDRGLRDLGPIGRLGATLESLSVEGAPGVPCGVPKLAYGV
jgi:hypothetical protein